MSRQWCNSNQQEMVNSNVPPIDRHVPKNINNVLKLDKLQFTLDAQNFNGASLPNDLYPNISINSSSNFLFLDTRMFQKPLKYEKDIKWNDEGIKVLSFGAHHKANQCLKYLSIGSTHKSTAFHVMLKGVCNCLVSLTSFYGSNSNKKLDQLCPIHAKALLTAGLMKEN